MVCAGYVFSVVVHYALRVLQEGWFSSPDGNNHIVTLVNGSQCGGLCDRSKKKKKKKSRTRTKSVWKRTRKIVEHSL